MNTLNDHGIEAVLRAFAEKMRGLADDADRLRAELATRLAAAPPPAPATSTDDEAWTVEQAAKFLGMSTTWVYKAAESGELPSTKLGRRRTFDPAAMRAYRAEHSRGGETAGLARRRPGDP